MGVKSEMTWREGSIQTLWKQTGIVFERQEFHSICVTEQDPMRPFQNEPPCMSFACLLPVEKNFSQRINVIREVKKCRKKGKQSSKTK